MKEGLLGCKLKRNCSALRAPGTDFQRSPNDATRGTAPRQETFRKVTQNSTRGLRGGSKSTPKAPPGGPKRSPGCPPGAPRNTEGVPGVPQASKPHACQQKWHPSRDESGGLGLPAPGRILVVFNSSFHPWVKTYSRSTAPHAGVGGLKRPAASAADPE